MFTASKGRSNLALNCNGYVPSPAFCHWLLSEPTFLDQRWRLPTLRSRIALPFALSQNYDALVADGRDNALIAITGANGTGIATIDLSSLSEPVPLRGIEDGSPQSASGQCL